MGYICYTSKEREKNYWKDYAFNANFGLIRGQFLFTSFSFYKTEENRRKQSNYSICKKKKQKKKTSKERYTYMIKTSKR